MANEKKTEQELAAERRFAGGDFDKVNGKVYELIRTIIGEHDNIGIGIEKFGLDAMAQCFLLSNKDEVFYHINRFAELLENFQDLFFSRRFIVIAYGNGGIIGWTAIETLDDCTTAIEGLWLDKGFSEEVTFDVLDTETNHIFGDDMVKAAVLKPFYVVHNVRQPMGEWQTESKSVGLDCIADAANEFEKMTKDYLGNPSFEVYRTADIHPYNVGYEAKVVKGVYYSQSDETDHEFLICKKLIHETI